MLLSPSGVGQTNMANATIMGEKSFRLLVRENCEGGGGGWKKKCYLLENSFQTPF
ncbi:hypothetical protein [Helicobacter macacae]|uniref:hypothetical protein n=1 Tax=Helicobacter macacae TaxID=398626 RepID=UPI00041A97EB|nr:hypothetical protein [Helicobacter macacae]